MRAPLGHGSSGTPRWDAGTATFLLTFSGERIAPRPPVPFYRDAPRSVPSSEDKHSSCSVFPRLFFCAEELVAHDIVGPATPLEPSVADRLPPTSRAAADSVH